MSGKKCLEKNPLPSSKRNGYDIMNCWWFGGCVMKDLIFTYFLHNNEATEKELANA